MHSSLTSIAELRESSASRKLASMLAIRVAARAVSTTSSVSEGGGRLTVRSYNRSRRRNSSRLMAQISSRIVRVR